MSVKVIEAVAVRPPLWDLSDPKFKDRSLKDRLWAEVADYAQLSVHEAKLKWCSARDYYMVLMRRKPITGSDGVYKPRWKHWDAMQFMQHSTRMTENFEDIDATITSRSPTAPESPSFYGLIPPTEIKYEIHETNEEIDLTEEDQSHQIQESEIHKQKVEHEYKRKLPTQKRKISHENESEENMYFEESESQIKESESHTKESESESRKKIPTKKKKIAHENAPEDNVEEELLELVRQQAKILERVANTQNTTGYAQSEQDDVEMFLLSLAPSLRRLSEEGNMIFRIKSQELLLKLMQEGKAEQNKRYNPQRPLHGSGSNGFPSNENDAVAPET